MSEEQTRGQIPRNLSAFNEATTQLLLGISDAFMRADVNALDAELARGLQLIGQEVGADAMSVCVADRHRLASCAEWREQEGVEPPLEVDLNLARWLRGQLDASATIVAETLSDLPREAPHELRLFTSRKVASLAALPLPGPIDALGYLFVEQLEAGRSWPDETLAQLTAFAELVGAALTRRAQYLAMVDRERAARDGERRQNQLLTMFAHELRAPLTAIIGYAEMIKELSTGPDAKKQKQYVGDLLESAHHMSTFISDTLILARIDGGEVSLMLTRFDIVDLLRGAIRQVIPRAKNAGIELEAELPDGTHYVFGDRSKLTQLVTNLLDNALKFTPQSGTVRLALQVNDDDYDIEVTDTGIGIPESEQKRIFRRFEQLSPGESHSGSAVGVGLGLALVKRLAELHEGDVFVDSTPKQGSSFRVSLKRRPTPPAPGSAKIRSFFD